MRTRSAMGGEEKDEFGKLNDEETAELFKMQDYQEWKNYEPIKYEEANYELLRLPKSQEDAGTSRSLRSVTESPLLGGGGRAGGPDGPGDRLSRRFVLPGRVKTPVRSVSFLVFIGTSVLSFVAIFPFQVWLLVNEIQASSFNGGVKLQPNLAMAFKVVSGLLIFSRGYQLFITVTVYVTKNSFQALYLLVYLIMVFVASTNYMLLYPASFSEAASHARALVSFATYWIIVVSGVTIVAQAVLFAVSLRKEISYLQFKSASSSISSRTLIVTVQNYRALVILNGFFITFDLVISCDFTSLATGLDAASVAALVLLGINPLVLVYGYFGALYKSVAAVAAVMLHLLVIFVYSMLSSMVFTTYPISISASGDTTVLYLAVIYSFRAYFSFLHYGLLIANYAVAARLLRLLYNDNSAQDSGYVSSAGFLNRFFLSKAKFKPLAQSALNSQLLLQPRPHSITTWSQILRRMSVLYTANTVIVVLCSVAGIALNALFYTVKKAALANWLAVSLISIIWQLLFTLNALYIWLCRGNSAVLPRPKHLLLLSTAASFLWLSYATYQTFSIFNWSNYYSFQLTNGNYFVEESMVLQMALSSSNIAPGTEIASLDTQNISQLYQCYKNAINRYLQNKPAAGIAVALAAVALVSTLSQTICFTYSSYLETQLLHKSLLAFQRQTSVPPLVSNLTLTVKLLTVWNIFAGISNISLITLFDAPYYHRPTYFHSYFNLIAPNWFANISITSAIFILVVSLLVAATKKHVNLLAPSILILHTYWLATLAYQFNTVLHYFNIFYNVQTQLSYFIYIMALIVMEIASAATTIALSGLLWYKYFKQSRKF